MSERSESLRRRREALVLRAAAQRGELAAVNSQLHARLWPVDLGMALARALRRRPLLAVAGAALLAGGRRNRLVAWGTRLVTLWELVDVVRKQALPRSR
jgi:hypothetical protein